MEARKTRLMTLAANLLRQQGAMVPADQAVEQVRDALSAGAGGATVSDADLSAALELAERNGLNPLAGDIRLYPSRDGLAMNPSVTIDGWIRVINAHPKIDGIRFDQSAERVMVGGRMAHEWVECSIHRKDRTVPTTVREYLDDCLDHEDPSWQMPNRVLRHRALVQCARIALGLACGLDDSGNAVATAQAGAAAAAGAQSVPVQMVSVDAGAPAQTASVESVAAAPDQSAGRPRRAASSRKTTAAGQASPSLEGVVLEAQESLLPAAQDEAPKADGTPPASAVAVQRLATKAAAMLTAEEMADLLNKAGVSTFDGMTEGALKRASDALDAMLAGGV